MLQSWGLDATSIDSNGCKGIARSHNTTPIPNIFICGRLLAIDYAFRTPQDGKAYLNNTLVNTIVYYEAVIENGTGAWRSGIVRVQFDENGKLNEADTQPESILIKK